MTRALVANVTHRASIRSAITYDLVGRDKHAPRTGSELLASSIPSSDPEQICAAFERQLSRHPPIAKPIYRTSLSVPSGVSLSPLMWLKIAEHWLRGMKIDPSSHHWYVARHQDSGHEHIHISVCRYKLCVNERGPRGGGSLWIAPFS